MCPIPTLYSSRNDGLCIRYAIVDPPEDEWGTLGADGQWSGVFGVVSRQEADAGWLPFEVTRHRARHFDFTSPTDHSTLTFVYRPAILDQRWLLLVRPLSWEVFACLAAAVPAVITVLLLTEMTSPVIRDLSRQDPRQNQHPITSRVRVMRILQRCCRVVIGAVLAEPCEYEWRSGPSRLVVACWWGVALVLGAAYSGSLVAQLSYFQPLVPFRTLEEVARQTEYSWGMLGNSSIHSMILQGNLSLYRNLREGLDRFVKTDPTVLAGDEGTHFNKVVGDKYVFIGMRDTIDLWLQRDCGLVRGEDPVRQLLVAPAFAKDSALTRYFSDVIEELRAVGLVDEWHKRWMPDGSDCTTISTQRHVTVSLAHLQGAFYVVASGCGLSTLLLLLEMCLARALRHRPAVQKRH
ncbi:hypothetical protein BaRGS_00005950 [Batillaria attramentaria]|uniref:Ionotropic glutamate receptor C-terminal domain-containing protein n=1 Tax=Batillaria attramentaria TaxID=370345 RepID=A0ABD0LSX5_9CAEN